MAARTLRTEKLDLRVSPSAKRTLEAAASVSNRTVSEFVLESALARANEALADRRVFQLSKAKWIEFLAALDAPTRPLTQMPHLLMEPGFFDAPPAPRAKAKR
ncbi:MAG: DUF1778 domain-containing protein [Nitrospira sp.]|jgi:uncharacterized protein (DUF1778 family)|nr:DUF1778 domain-containing protein [Nitrospira sp.]